MNRFLIGAATAASLLAGTAPARAQSEASAVGAISVGVGTAVVVTAIGTGWVLSAAGRAVCFVPNAIGQALLHDERLTR